MDFTCKFSISYTNPKKWRCVARVKNRQNKKVEDENTLAPLSMEKWTLRNPFSIAVALCYCDFHVPASLPSWDVLLAKLCDKILSQPHMMTMMCCTEARCCSSLSRGVPLRNLVCIVQFSLLVADATDSQHSSGLGFCMDLAMWIFVKRLPLLSKVNI